jgi:hypothetical protein
MKIKKQFYNKQDMINMAGSILTVVGEGYYKKEEYQGKPIENFYIQLAFDDGNQFDCRCNMGQINSLSTIFKSNDTTTWIGGKVRLVVTKGLVKGKMVDMWIFEAVEPQA